MAAQVDGSRCDVYVHEVVNYSALNVVLDPVHKVSTSHIKDLYVGEFPDQIYGIEDKKKLKINVKSQGSICYAFLSSLEERCHRSHLSFSSSIGM